VGSNGWSIRRLAVSEDEVTGLKPVPSLKFTLRADQARLRCPNEQHEKA
jgi:hypothetical protein